MIDKVGGGIRFRDERFSDKSMYGNRRAGPKSSERDVNIAVPAGLISQEAITVPAGRGPNAHNTAMIRNLIKALVANRWLPVFPGEILRPVATWLEVGDCVFAWGEAEVISGVIVMVAVYPIHMAPFLGKPVEQASNQTVNRNLLRSFATEELHDVARCIW